jgi:TonB family protein
MVVVRVTVDSAGRVTDATLEPGGSPYFGRLAQAATRQWQFASVEDVSPRNWILHFSITQTDTWVEARRAVGE